MFEGAMSFAPASHRQADNSSEISDANLFTLGPSVGVFESRMVAAEFGDNAWAHFTETSCLESQHRTCADPISELRPDAGLAAFNEDIVASRQSAGVDGVKFEEEENEFHFVHNSLAMSKDKDIFKCDLREIDAQFSPPCLAVNLKEPLMTPNPAHEDDGTIQEPGEADTVNFSIDQQRHSNQKPADLDFDSHSSSLGAPQIPDPAPHLTKEERALRRRVFHKVHTRRSRAKLNEKLDHLRLILPPPPPGTCVKSKAQILDWAISCAGRFSSKPLSIVSKPYAVVTRPSNLAMRDTGRPRKQRNGRAQARNSK